jgi:hypothetical protein
VNLVRDQERSFNRPHSSRRICVVLAAAALLLATASSVARADDAPKVAGTIAQAVCESQTTFPTFTSFGDCVQYVIAGGAVGVRLGALSDEQIVFSLVIQNGAVTEFAGVNNTSCIAVGTIGAVDGQEITLTLAPGESDSVAIPSELGGIDVTRFRGDIPQTRKGALGFTTSFNQFGAGTGC